MPRRATALFNFSDPWMREVILRAAPPEFDVRFVGDPADRRTEDLLAGADFLVTVELPGAWVPLLKRCRLVQTQGVGFDAVDSGRDYLPGVAAAAEPPERRWRRRGQAGSRQRPPGRWPLEAPTPGWGKAPLRPQTARCQAG